MGLQFVEIEMKSVTTLGELWRWFMTDYYQLYPRKEAVTWIVQSKFTEILSRSFKKLDLKWILYIFDMVYPS